MKRKPVIHEFPEFRDVEWSMRALNALAIHSITSFRQVAALTHAQMTSMRRIGSKTIREITSQCVKRGIRPASLKHWIGNCHDTDTTGMVKLAGPFGLGERGMLEAAIALLNPEIRWATKTDALDPSKVWLWRDKNGYVEVGDEE